MRHYLSFVQANQPIPFSVFFQSDMITGRKRPTRPRRRRAKKAMAKKKRPRKRPLQREPRNARKSLTSPSLLNLPPPLAARKRRRAAPELKNPGGGLKSPKNRESKFRNVFRKIRLL